MKLAGEVVAVIVIVGVVCLKLWFGAIGRNYRRRRSGGPPSAL
jgi:hypothetical protein